MILAKFWFEEDLMSTLLLSVRVQAVFERCHWKMLLPSMSLYTLVMWELGGKMVVEGKNVNTRWKLYKQTQNNQFWLIHRYQLYKCKKNRSRLLPSFIMKSTEQEVSSNKIIVEANRALRSWKKERVHMTWDEDAMTQGRNVIRIWTKTTKMGQKWRAKIIRGPKWSCVFRYKRNTA